MKTVLTSLLIVSLVLLAGVGCDSKKTDAKKSEAEAADQKKEEKADSKKEQEKQAAQKQPEADQAGQWVESELYGLKFRVPEAWEVVTDEEGASATDPEGTTTVLLAGSESQQLVQSTLNDLRSDLNFKEVKLEKSGLTTINGIPAVKGSGTAVMTKDDMDQEIQFLGYQLKLGDKTATMLIFSQAEMYEAKKEMIQGIAKTLVETS